MQILSYILSVAGLITLIAASVVKGEKIGKLLLLTFAGNVLIGLSYIASGKGMNGMVSSFVGAFQAIVNYGFSVKNIPVPKWLIAVYGAMFVVLNAAVLTDAAGLLAIAATLCYVACISVKSTRGYRLWHSGNSVLWILYDVVTKSHAPLVTHGVLCTFNVIGILINDVLNCRKKNSAE